MNFLVLVASNSGSTLSATQIVSDTLTQTGHTVTMKNPKDSNIDEFEKANVILFASPSWDYEGKEGQPHEDFLPLMTSLNEKVFEKKPMAILGLGDSSYSYYCGAVDVFEKFVSTLKGKLVVPSLRIDKYYQNSQNADYVRTWAQTLSKSFTT